MVDLESSQKPSAQDEGRQSPPAPCTVSAPAAPGPAPTRTRKRRAHTKSRQGCANCKLRGIKVSANIFP